jgi:tetratricopeptide (TPR) repeat protein
LKIDVRVLFEICGTQGVYMKRFALSFLAVFVMTTAAYSADDPVARAMKLYEKRHYEEAATSLTASLASVEQSRQGAAHLALGMIYLKNAELYRKLYQASLAVSQDYLKKLSAGRGRNRSRFADLYLGEALFEAGNPAAAAGSLKRFVADESVDQRSRTIGKVVLGSCYYRNGDKQKAEDIWTGMDSADPEVLGELAAAFSTAGLKDKNPEALIEQGLGAVKKTGKALSIRMVKNALSVYARDGRTDQGLELIKRVDIKAYSRREFLGKLKVLSFYELSLLGDLATLYSQASTAHLEKAAADAAVKDPAEYYLGEAYALFGNIDQSSKVTASFISATRMPRQYKDRMRIWQAGNHYQKGRHSDALGVWEELSSKQPIDSDLVAETLLVCARVKADCQQIVKRAETTVEAGGGKRVAQLNVAIGNYYLGKRNWPKALAYMEAGRDKSNKNKIESNDPLMLADLAGLYYRSKKFSEAIEIYFEMSKQFPAVRQIQEAMQGVYAMEQKSAGDVKIF